MLPDGKIFAERNELTRNWPVRINLNALRISFIASSCLEVTYPY